MQILILKNLTAHKIRNQLTAIIYSLTLGCLIFLVVMLNIQIIILATSTDLRVTSDVYATPMEHQWVHGYKHFFSPSDVDPVLKKYSYGIKDFGYMTYFNDINITELTQFKPSILTRAYSVSPSPMLEAMLGIKNSNTTSALSPITQLYTARGS